MLTSSCAVAKTAAGSAIAKSDETCPNPSIFTRCVKKCKKAVHGREKFHSAVSELLQANGDLLGVQTDDIVSAVFSDSQLEVFNEQAPTCQAPGAGGYVPRQEKNMEKAFHQLNSTHKECQRLGAVLGTAEHKACKAAEKKHNDLIQKSEVS